MSRPEPLRPMYDFSSAPDAVSLLHGEVEVVLDEDKYCGRGDLVLSFIPSPRIVFRADALGSSDSVDHFFSEVPDDSSFSFDGRLIEGFPGQWSRNPGRLRLDWHSTTEPVALCDLSPRNSVWALFHVFNFPDFRGGQHQDTAPAGCSLLVLESEEWRWLLQELPDNATQGAWGRIKDDGGCFLTHVLKLERRDGEPFSGEEATEEAHLLRNFLSFLKGGRCEPVCGIGFDATGGKAWETFSSPHAVERPFYWFNPFQASQAEILYPLFAKRWRQSDEWKDCLRSAVYWYLQSNTSGGAPGVDAAIILAQAGLERLAHHHLVVDRKMISREGLDRLRPSDRLRLLFSSLNIPVEISAATPDIQRVAPSFQWVDAPHAMTDIRNELVHPVSKKQVTGCFFDAWKLSVWYLELVILALCDYNATYTSRLTAKYLTDSERVPWGRKA